MSRFTNIITTNATAENLTANIIQSVNATGIQLLSDMNFNGQSASNLNRLSFTNYEIVEDYITKTLAVHILGTRFKGALYDTMLNKPYEQVLPLSRPYALPANEIILKNDIVANPYKVFIIEPTENTTIDLPALTPMNVFQNTHVRFSNDSKWLVSFTYNGSHVIQIGCERASFIWHTTNGTDYDWSYIS